MNIILNRNSTQEMATIAATNILVWSFTDISPLSLETMADVAHIKTGKQIRNVIVKIDHSF